MPIDPPFDASNAWWPSPGWPRSGPLGGPPYPDYWTDPFINSRAIAPAAPAPFSAAQIGAMAWHPPIFPGDASTFAPSNFPAAAWSLQPVPPAAATSSSDLTPALDWPNAGLFSRDPSLPVGGGLFPYPLPSSPEPTSPFGDGLFSGNPAALAPLPGMPGASPTPGWPVPQSFLAPLAQSQSATVAGGSPLDLSSSLSAGSAYPPPGAAPPTRSVMFNQAPAAWDPGARERDLANLDQTAQTLGVAGLPTSKSGTSFVSPRPQLSITPEQWLDVARLLAQNTVDYFTKTLPPSRPCLPVPARYRARTIPTPQARPSKPRASFWPRSRVASPLRWHRPGAPSKSASRRRRSKERSLSLAPRHWPHPPSKLWRARLAS
jgi:hypothetical protein